MRMLLAAAAAGLLGAGCAGGRAPATPTAMELGELYLQEQPTMAARLEYDGPDRRYHGPARLQVKAVDPVLHLVAEDFDIAEQVEVRVISTDPVAYGPVAGNAFRDVGTYVRDRDRLILNFTRTWPPHSTIGDTVAEGDEEPQAHVVILGNMAPVPHKPPRDWLEKGTTLYYGITWDDKPITRLVPMGLQITVASNDSGGWVLLWMADLDPATQQDVTGELFRRGVVTIPPEVAEKAAVHDDRLDDGEVELTHTAIFVPRSARRNLSTYGAAAWEDPAVGGPGLLQAARDIDVVLQADDALWKIPATVAVTHGGEGVYVIASDEDAPLILSASRPGWKMKLMALGRPDE